MRWVALALFVMSVALASAPAVAERERTGPDSFLRWRAYTVEDLVSQVHSDAVLRQRLARHFRVSQADVVSYLRANIRVITFDRSGWRTVYGVTRDGRIYKARDYFHKGGKVFGLVNGMPVLKYACGNPLITKLPAVGKPLALVPRQALPPQPQVPQEFALVVPTPTAPVVETPAVVPFETPVETTTALPAAARFEVPLAQAVAPGRAAVPLWPLGLGFLPFLDHDHEQPSPVIPEPGSILLLAGGLAVLAGLARLQRSR
jgi:hypothetical protein